MRKAPQKPTIQKSVTRLRRFEATLERMRSRLNWTIIRVPFDAAKVFGGRGQIKVRVEINGFPYRTSLFPTGLSPEGKTGHILLVNKQMQKAARVRAGGSARFQIELDTEERIVTIPDRLKRIFAEDRAFRRWYDQLNHSSRSDIAKWVTEPKSEEARVRRAEQMTERLLAVMEAERELPPILRVAFARNPRARAGWDRMSMARRRSHLMGIFYYRTPEGQARRVQKVMEDAERKSGDQTI
jgi:uncharacterized protein YdeI (YjbR/CyaY-like superfamily)